MLRNLVRIHLVFQVTFVTTFITIQGWVTRAMTSSCDHAFFNVHILKSHVGFIDKINIAELQIEPNQNHLLTNLEGSIFAWLFGWLVVVCHGGDSSDVTLAFENAQVIQTLMDDK